jgi:hypothetical protein
MFRRIVLGCSLIAHVARADEGAVVSGTGFITTFENPFAAYLSSSPSTVRLWSAGLSAAHALDPDRHVVGELTLAGTFGAALESDLQLGPGYAAGAGLALYLQRAYTGPFISAGLLYASLPSNDPSYFRNGSPSAWSARLALGYEMTFANGLSIAVSAGLAETWIDWWDNALIVGSASRDPYGCSSVDSCSYSTDSFGFAAELRVGYAL